MYQDDVKPRFFDKNFYKGVSTTPLTYRQIEWIHSWKYSSEQERSTVELPREINHVLIKHTLGVTFLDIKEKVIPRIVAEHNKRKDGRQLRLFEQDGDKFYEIIYSNGDINHYEINSVDMTMIQGVLAQFV